MEIAAGQLGAALLQRSNVVEHEQAPAMSGHNQIMALFHELDVINRRSREVALDLNPVRAVVTGVVKTGISAGRQEPLMIGIFAHYPYRVVLRQALHDRGLFVLDDLTPL